MKSGSRPLNHCIMDNQFTADNVGKLKNIVKRNAGPAGILFLLYLAAALPLLSADFYYRDDLRRAATGFRGWEVGRYLSLLGSVILHTDTYLADISPLPQLAALVILAVSAVMLRRVIGRERRFGFWDYAALFPVAFFPHFLNCLSYKYDAPYMALSIGVSIAPLLFRRCRRSVYCAGVFVGTLAMCMLYQASSGIFPVIVAYLVMTGDPAGRSGEKKPGDGKTMTEDTAGGSGKKRRGAVNEGLAFAAWSAAFYVLAMVFFRLFIMQPLSDYVSTELAEPGALFSVLAGNYR